MSKRTLFQRLNIIKGQIDGLAKLIENDEKNCQRVVEQFRAIEAAFKKVMELYFEKNLISCLSLRNVRNKKTINLLIKELIKNKK